MSARVLTRWLIVAQFCGLAACSSHDTALPLAAVSGSGGSPGAGATADGRSGTAGAGGSGAGVFGGAPGTAGFSAAPIANDLVRLDSIVFGDAQSETKHELATAFFAVQAVVAPLPSDPPTGNASDVVQGALGLSARRLLPRTPNADYYGGEMSFTLAVDPNQQNYFTAKLWGSEPSNSWLILNVDGFEVGARHAYGAGSSNEMIFANSFGWLPNRFLYRTERIPKNLTQGKKRITIKLRSLGELKYYAGGSYDNAQARMIAPTVGIYAAYTHNGSFLDPADEARGSAPAMTAATPPTSADENAMLKGWRDRVNARIADRLAVAADKLNSDDVQFLAEAHEVTWTSGYGQATVVSQVRASIDAMVTAYAADPTAYLGRSYPANAGWGGYFGPIGEAIRLLWPALGGSMSATVAYGGLIGTAPRKTAWAKALRASIDFGRFDRKTITNQQMDAGFRIYAANRGLLLVDPPSAFSEDEARRYLYEAVGISPFLGNDQPGDGNKPVYGTAPYGADWYTVTTRGTSKEDGLVGGDYGERGAQVVDWYRRNQDPKLLRQAKKMLSVRAPLRHIVADQNGHPVSYAVEQIGCRNSQEVDSHLVYLGRGGAPDVAAASLGISQMGADVIGYLQQQHNDGQLLPTLGNVPENYWRGAAYLPDDYQAFRAEPATGVGLPMSAGHADFAWADEENMVLAAKQGDERFWAVLNWRAAEAINGLARVYLETPTVSFLAEVSIDDVQFTPSGKLSTESGNVEGFPPWTPPDKPVNAEQGVTYPIALRPGLSASPATNRDGGRGSAYTLRYGHWLVAINAHPSDLYAMKLPDGFVSAIDLVSGKPLTAPVSLAPKSAVVFRVPLSAAN